MLVAQLSVRGLALLRTLARARTPLSTSTLRQNFAELGAALSAQELSSALRRLERRGYVTSTIGRAPTRTGVDSAARLWAPTPLGERQADTAVASLRRLSVL